MRSRVLLATGFLVASMLPSAAADLSGKWVISGIAAPTCSFTQSGDFFRGTCDGPGASGVAFGVVDPQIIRWTYQWKSKTDGSAGAFVFGGQLGPDGSITGAALNTNGASGQFTAQRQ